MAKSPNPFAAVVLAHLEAIETRKDPDERRRRKLALVKGLYRQEWSAEDVRRLFGIIDWVLTLPDDMNEKFWSELNEHEEESKMQYVTSVERIGIQKGMKIGLEQGTEKGLEQGTEKGLLEAIQMTLEAKFGSAGLKLLSRMATFDANRLREMVKFLQTAKTVEQVRNLVNTLRGRAP